MIEKQNKTYNERVRDFHVKFKQVANETPSFTDRDTRRLRLALILEELTELARGMGHESYGDFQRMLFEKSQKVHKDAEATREKLQPDIVECFDALIDIQYVLSGTIVAMGFEKIFDKGFDEVHDSNMSKASADETIANLTSDKFTNQGVNNYLEKQEDGSWLCFRASDKKLLKSVGYRAADLKTLVEDELPKSNGE